MTPQLPDLIKHIKQSLRPETKTLDSQRALFYKRLSLPRVFSEGYTSNLRTTACRHATDPMVLRVALPPSKQEDHAQTEFCIADGNFTPTLRVYARGRVCFRTRF